jgi:hypothetical protein
MAGCASGNFTQFVEARVSLIVARELRYLETAICPGAKDAMRQQRPIPESPGSQRRLDFPPYGL